MSSNSAPEEDANGTEEAGRALGGLLSMSFGRRPQGNNGRTREVFWKEKLEGCYRMNQGWKTRRL